ncbi:hypothetical protein DdX_20103 [Ditylenchus destructor]|uniref:Uncharacterized protein n=1 Tax=Ditylenchus destructor TaxID=166010 RepID=A0AAD4MHW7_9BILA|nr:hypothetical protein DdX_20103 [Ditylenchus destructor]
MAPSKVVIIAFLVVASSLIGEAAKRHRWNMAAGTTCSNGSTQTVSSALQDCEPTQCQTCVDLCAACTQSGRTCSGCTCDPVGCPFCICDCS